MDKIAQRIRLQLHDLEALKDKIQCIINNSKPKFTTSTTATYRRYKLYILCFKIIVFKQALYTYELNNTTNK